jgi:hypothetical protein
MAGLSLRSGLNVGGSYTPMTPASATPPSSSSISQLAYGINGTGDDTQRTVAGYGSVSVGIIALAGLIYLWWTLPR